MKLRLFLLFSVALLCAAGCQKPSEGFQEAKMNIGKMAIVDTRNNKYVSIEALSAEMKNYDVIFVGEKHDHTVGHIVENQLLRNLFAQDNNVSVSMEMFERDIQVLVDSYLAGETSEEDFQKGSRPWPNYVADYRPMVEFAKEHSLPVIAANVPRNLAGKVARLGMDKLSEKEKEYCCKEVYAPDDEYKERFLETMIMLGGGSGRTMPMAGNAKMREALYMSQCVKDSTMAEAIVAHIALTGRKVIHYNGSFHSDYGLGTADRVKRLNSNLKVLVLTIQQSEVSNSPIPEKYDTKVADFIILTER